MATLPEAMRLANSGSISCLGQQCSVREFAFQKSVVRQVSKDVQMHYQSCPYRVLTP